MDDDDEMLPHAASTLMRVATRHPDVDKITCDCVDSVTKRFTGSGLGASQYVDFPERRLHGQFWGITKTELLRGRRFDERVTGFEVVLCLKLSAEATCYYLHEGLYVHHDEGDDGISKRMAAMDLEHRVALYLPLADDAEYRSLVRTHVPGEFAKLTFYSTLALIGAHRRIEAWAYLREYGGPNVRRAFLVSASILAHDGSPSPRE